MHTVLVGLGNQGRKRLAVAQRDVVATVDPFAPGADFATIEQVPVERYDAALVCTSDAVKVEVLSYLLGHGKHVLVEKPLLPADPADLLRLRTLAQSAGVACYTAYNHRFEPNVRRLRDVLQAGVLGPLYLGRFHYGNGTAVDVRNSAWRDQGLGVLADLGSHLLDLVAFLLGPPTESFRLFAGHRFENAACDHVLFGTTGVPALTLETSLVCWRNTFAIDLYGAQGSAHVEGLCKWGPSYLRVRRRVWPSGKPTEEGHGEELPDPTWAAEYEHFRDLCRRGESNLDNDVWIASILRGLAPSDKEQRWAA